MHDLFRFQSELSTLRGSWVISCGLFSPAMTKLFPRFGSIQGGSMNDRSVLLRRAVIGALVLASTPALAQQPTQSDENTRTIDTIIVTAQKREQSLQDVPIVVTAVSEQLIRD